MTVGILHIYMDKTTVLLLMHLHASTGVRLQTCVRWILFLPFQLHYMTRRLVQSFCPYFVRVFARDRRMAFYQSLLGTPHSSMTTPALVLAAFLAKLG